MCITPQTESGCLGTLFLGVTTMKLLFTFTFGVFVCFFASPGFAQNPRESVLEIAGFAKISDPNRLSEAYVEIPLSSLRQGALKSFQSGGFALSLQADVIGPEKAVLKYSVSRFTLGKWHSLDQGPMRVVRGEFNQLLSGQGEKTFLFEISLRVGSATTKGGGNLSIPDKTRRPAGVIRI